MTSSATEPTSGQLLLAGGVRFAAPALALVLHVPENLEVGLQHLVGQPQQLTDGLMSSQAQLYEGSPPTSGGVGSASICSASTMSMSFCHCSQVPA